MWSHPTLKEVNHATLHEHDQKTPEAFQDYVRDGCSLASTLDGCGTSAVRRLRSGRVIPELQPLAVGDTVALGPPRALVLHYRMNALTAAPAGEGEVKMLTDIARDRRRGGS